VIPGLSANFALYLAQTLGPLLILFVIAVFAAFNHLRPAPPSELTFASGPPGSRFSTETRQYQKILAPNGITLRIIATEGSLDNLHRLLDARSGVDIALVQTAISGAAQTDDLVSLVSMFYEPLLIFHCGSMGMLAAKLNSLILAFGSSSGS